MRSVKVWLLGTVLLAVVVWTGLLFSMSAVSRAEPERGKDHWHHHDGHWSYWHEGDKRWYYTDGTHWFYNGGDAWKLYPFDKQFGREGFERGEYRVPEDRSRLVVPRHRVFRR